MECHDRIAIQISEIALEPVKLLRERSLLAAVTVRALRRGDRFNVTIRKVWPDGMDAAPDYRWRLVEIDATGAELPDRFGFETASLQSNASDDPEDAYWAAVEALGNLVGQV